MPTVRKSGQRIIDCEDGRHLDWRESTCRYSEHLLRDATARKTRSQSWEEVFREARKQCLRHKYSCSRADKANLWPKAAFYESVSNEFDGSKGSLIQNILAECALLGI